MGWVIREVSFPCNAPDEEGAYRAYATDERRSRSRPERVVKPPTSHTCGIQVRTRSGG
ncbi:MAG: hypothetical protein KTR25_09780 [Myxococcales bacterium]|nr:hypothetical protein [Myxococcales bacterium]